MGQHTAEVTFGPTGQLEFPFAASKPAAIIGLAGRRGVGKNTVARVAGELDPSVVELSFGAFVKDEVAEVINHSRVWLDEHKEQLRPLLQAWSTEWRRDLCDEDYWVKRLAEQLNTVPDESIVFITDVRFANEAEFIRGRGGVVVRVQREQWERPPEMVDLHASEMSVDRCRPDAQFNNSGPTPESIRKDVEALIEWALAKRAARMLPESELLVS